MKRSIIFLLLLLAVLFHSCTPENEIADKSQVQFVINLADVSGDDVMSSNVKSILLHVQDANGDVAIDQNVDFVREGNVIKVKQINLPTGVYSVEDIFISDSEGNVLFATPKKGSMLATLNVQSMAFMVKNTESKAVELQAISTTKRTSVDFGYTSFKKKGKGTFQIAIRDAKGKLIKGIAYLIEGEDTVGQYTLHPKINTISYCGNKLDSVTLVIVKDGFGKYSGNFTYGDLAKYKNKPISIILKNALTFRFHTLPTSFKYALPVVFPAGTTGNLTVDWGDGTVEAYSFESDELSHVYTTEGDYFLTLTGDVEKITEIFDYNDPFEVTSVYNINVDNLTNLQFIAIGWTHAPAIIDLSHNKQLQVIDFSDLAELHNLILPAHHYLRYFNLTENNDISSTLITSMIKNIYSNAVSKNIVNGYLNIGDENGVMVGPPSATAIMQLQQLHTVYAWNVIPNP